MKVKALKRGTYPNHREREIGDVFDYDGPTRITRGGKEVDYFPSWMEPLEAREPDKDEDLAELRQKYELVVGKKPHHMKKAETLRKEIDEAIKAKSE
ncbi:hypothetical protein [Halomonas cupida]|uniref:hypothetical protein n=1 Tax=Halomonas cupida TaxID=44933 RepID=UPI003A8EC8DA